ncbi:MAG TPA: hypothetical protein VD866_15215 [Urbifossiella sp.]|nr:hypothetical protein [Urbifossiella sp.]
MRKLMLTGVVAVAGVLAFSADAQAFGKRKKNKGGCNDCATAAPVYTGYAGHGGYSGCGGCGTAWAGGPAGYAMAAPEAMPATGTTTTIPNTQPGAVVPASGTTGGTVVPATGTTQPQPQPQSYVVPAGGYYLQNGQYVMPAGGYYQGGQYVAPAGYGTFQSGFGSGVLQGGLYDNSSSYIPFGSSVPGVIGNYAGQQVGRGLFRRR